MPSFFVQFATIWVAIIAISYPLFLRKVLFESLGINRDMQELSEFPYACRKIIEPLTEGCEDMWIDHEKRVLYAACAPTRGRVQWTPSMTLLNQTGRSGKDHILMLDLDSPGVDGKFGMRELEFTGYKGPAGSTKPDVHGFSVDILDDNTLRFIMVNHKPAADESGIMLLQAKEFGANSTVEFFELARGAEATALEWKRTVYDPAIYTPNRVASMGNGDFYVTNDRYSKVGMRREVFPLHAQGDVAYCPAKGPCKKASGDVRFTYPNGLVRGTDGRIYVPSSWLGKWWVFEVQEDFTLTKVDELDTAMPVDNLSVDDKGDIYAAAFPDLFQFTRTVANPFRIESPTAVLRVRRLIGSNGKVTHLQEKIVEDKWNQGTGGATVAVHDTKTGRLFLGGNFAPYISVCDKK